MRRKGEIRISTKERSYPFSAELQVHHRQCAAERAAEHAAANAISFGDYMVGSSKLDCGRRYLFRSGDQAHGMQTWMEAHLTPYDPWEERRDSREASRRSLKEAADAVSAAAATGIPARLLRARALGYDMADALRMLEPRFDKPRANWLVGMLNHHGAFPS